MGYTNACTQHRFGPPRNVSSASPYSRLDRPVSGSTPVTHGTFIPRPSLRAGYRFRYGCIWNRFTLATEAHSLARYSKRTIQLRGAVSLYLHETSGSFHSLLRVLFNIPSQYWYAIGLKKCLRLEVNASQIQTQFPVGPTQDTCTSFFLLLRDYHPVSCAVPGDFRSEESD